MGMFDYVTCLHPLPEGAPQKGYQTKDTAPQFLLTLTIEEDGTLTSEGEAVPFHGVLSFYWSNVSGSCKGGYVTQDGQPATSWEFEALYDRGKLVRIDGGREDVTEYWPPEQLLTREQFHKHLRAPSTGDDQ